MELSSFKILIDWYYVNAYVASTKGFQDKTQKRKKDPGQFNIF